MLVMSASSSNTTGGTCRQLWVASRSFDCSCAVCGDPVPCEHAWFCKGWRCPYMWRPNCEVVEPGSVVTFRTKARMWTSTPDDWRSEIYRAVDFGGTGRQYNVAEVRVSKHYTTVRVECELTRFAGWVRIWSRYNDRRQSHGARWADVVRSTWSSRHRARAPQFHAVSSHAVTVHTLLP